MGREVKHFLLCYALVTHGFSDTDIHGTLHVKMDLIFHSRAQREMALYKVGGSPVDELL